MSGVQEDAVQLISGLLGHIKQIVGDGASYAMLHYGAVEEGKRLGAAFSPTDLDKMLARIDGILGQHSEIVKDDGGTITIRITQSQLLRTGHRSMQGVVLGLVEGGLAATRHGRFKGQLVPATSSDELVLELKKEG